MSELLDARDAAFDYIDTNPDDHASRLLSALMSETRDFDLILHNRNAQLERLVARLNAKEKALQLVMDAVSLAEAKRIAREGIHVV